LLKSQHRYRIILWVAVILYTAALPYVILVFNAITRYFPAGTAGNVPFFIIILMAVPYAITAVSRKGFGRCIVILAVSTVISLGIMAFEANSNKYIHIPEYVLMVWLLYLAMIVDYKGRGILLLVFICASMLGVVDELLQGIHPQRSYGWKDMIIDTASSLIGILTLMGVTDRLKGDWSWIGHLKHYRAFVAVIVTGVPTTLLMCIYLFAVQTRASFDNVYPGWLSAGNALFLASPAAAIIFSWHRRPRSGKFMLDIYPDTVDYRTTARLWVICHLVILFSMNLIVIGVAVFGWEFR